MTAPCLEIDHREDWAEIQITLLSLLDGLCRHHHHLKTYKKWSLVDGKGKREMVPPGDWRHPKRRRAGPAPPPNAGDAKTETKTARVGRLLVQRDAGGVFEDVVCGEERSANADC